MQNGFLVKRIDYKYKLLWLVLLIAQSIFAQKDSTKTFKITITTTKKHIGDTLFIAGSFNGWNPHDVTTMMLPNKENIYKLSLLFKQNDLIQWKITRGNWNKVEVNDDGTDIQNRTNQFNTSITQSFIVNVWKDDFSSGQKLHTASPQVHIMDTAFNLKTLGRKRKIWIYLPKEYSTSDKKYPGFIYARWTEFIRCIYQRFRRMGFR